MSDRLLAAAKVYAFNYLQDEAEEVESCTCGPKQHAEAKELFAAIREAEAAPLPAEQPSNPVPLTEPEILALYQQSFNAMIGRLRDAPKSLPPTVIEFARLIEARIVGQQTKGGSDE